MKKLPIIGLLVGAVAAIVIKKKKTAEPELEVAGAPVVPETPADDTTPTA